MKTAVKRRTATSQLAWIGILAGVLGVAAPTIARENDANQINGNVISGNVIRACIHKENGELRVIMPNRQCRREEIAISWNIQGPQGPAGPQGMKGDPGDPGDPGMQGPAGVSGLERVSFSSPNNSDKRKPAFARCPAGKHVVGGGAQIFIGENRVVEGPIAIKKSWPSDAMDGWAATAEEVVDTDVKWFVTAYALCAMVAP